MSPPAIGSRDSVVSIVSRLWIGRSVVRIPAGREILLFCKRSGPALGPTQPPSQRVPEVNRPGGGGDSYHSPPFSVEVRKEWRHTLTPLYAFVS